MMTKPAPNNIQDTVIELKDAPAWNDVLQIAKGKEILLTPEKAQALIRSRREMLNESNAFYYDNAKLKVETEQLRAELIKSQREHEFAAKQVRKCLIKYEQLRAELANHATFQHIDDDRLAKRNMELEAENKRLRAELAALKSARVDEASDYLDSISDGARGIE